MDLPIPPFDRYRVRLRLTAPARFQFLHGGVLRGLVSAALDEHDLPPGVVPFAPESGRLDFAAGDSYSLGITFVGDHRPLGGRLFAGLAKLGTTRRPNRPTLGGNFEVESIDVLPPIDLDAEAHELASRDHLTTEFLSPLRLKRPAHLLVPGGGFVNGDCFPGDHFLERLWNRLFLIAHGRYPEYDERRAACPTATDVAIAPGDMLWLDHEVTGTRAKQRIYPIGGVLGRVTWTSLPEAWLRVLVAGRHLHAGAAPAYGFGRYRFLPESTSEPFAPSQPLWAGERPLAALPPQIDSILDSLVEGSNLTLRLGLSHRALQRAEREARRDGYRWRRRADLSWLLSRVDPSLVHQRLRALFPLHLDDDGHGSELELRSLTPTTRSTLALLVLPEIAGALPRHIRLLRMADGYFLLTRDTLRLSALAGGKVYLAAQPAAESWHARSLG